jgi:Tfp pilus assembly protein PilX
MHLPRHQVRKSGRKQQDQKGLALIFALLLLLMLTGLGVVMVISTNSDLATNGYYRGFRAAFYAGDSGLNIARQEMINEMLAFAPANFSQTQQPFPPLTEQKVKNNLTNTYGSYYQSISGSGQAYGSWPEKFKITFFTMDPPTCAVVGGTGTCLNPVGATGYSYIYPYTITAVGQAQGTEKATLSDRGSLVINFTLNTANSKKSFAAWGMFIDQYSICNGSTLVPGTITGPVFTNGAWNFGTSGSYIFTDKVGSASAQAGYQFSNKCDQVAGTSDKQGNTTIAPTFQNGFDLGQPKVPLPPNDFNQERAVLDGKGSGGTQVSNSDLHNNLRNISGTTYPSTGATSGVYLPYNIVSGTPTFTGGGIYVEGNASVTLSTSGTTGQVYTITQGSTTTTITVNNSANTTTVVTGGTTLNITGVPQLMDPSTGASLGPATMLYVDGSITALKGPGQGTAAIQDGTALTITAASNVTITGDILYKTPPVTLTANQVPGTPADTLIPGNDKGQVLGIFTANGDIQLANAQSNGNLEIDASLATLCDPSGGSCSGTGGLVNTGNAINTLAIVGGRIQNQIKNINSTTRNVFFDRRFAQNNFAPPWFPSTTVTLGGVNGGSVTATVQRVQWLNQTPYF